MSRRDEVIEIILAVARELNETLDRKIDVELRDTAPLYGRDGVLDSLSLVSLVAAVEQAIDDRYEAAVSLADERAVSQTSSPFRTVGSLADYALTLIGP